MNQGIQNCNGNYRQFFFPSAQTIYMVPQSQQIGVNQVYHQYNQYPNNQYLIYPQMQTSYPLMLYSNENSIWNNKHYENTNNNIIVNDKNQQYQNEQGQMSLKVKELKCEDYNDQEISNAIKENKSKICFVRTNKLEGKETQYFESEFSQDNESLNASSYNNLNKKNLQIDYLCNSNINCMKKIVTVGSVSINDTILKPSKIQRKNYPQAEDFPNSLQAGYRFINKCEGDHKIEIIKTTSSLKQIQQFKIQEQGEYYQNQNLDTYHHKTYINLNVQDAHQVKNFYQSNISPKVTRKEQKIEEKQFEKQQQDFQYQEYEQRSFLQIQEQNLNHKISEKEDRLQQSYSGLLPITEKNYKNQNKKCIYNKIERQRDDFMKQFRNENDMAQILIDKLTSFKQQTNNTYFQNQNVQDNQQKIKVESFDKNERVIIQDFNKRYNNQNLYQDQDYHQSSQKEHMNTPIQYSDYLLLLYGKNMEEDFDKLQSNIFKILKDKANSLLEDKTINETSFLNQNLQKNKFLNDQDANVLSENQQLEIKQDIDQYDPTIHTLVLCEKLMESTQTHTKIFELINQNYQYSPQDEKDQNLNKIQIPHNSQQTIANSPHPQPNEDLKIKSNKSQQTQINNDQIYCCTSESCSSEKRISLPQKDTTISPLNQEFNLISFSVKNPMLFEKFDFSQVRQITQKYRSTRKHKLNSTYKANSKYHNMNKLLMYNIMSMFQIENLMNINLDESFRNHLAQIVKVLKLLSKRSSKRYKFEYFSREHYHVLFLKITPNNFEFLTNSEKDRFLHEKCYNIDFSKSLSPVELNYINIIKNLFLQIFLILIQHDKIIEDGTNTKQNLRKQYCLKAINGIKKLSLGEILVRF